MRVTMFVFKSGQMKSAYIAQSGIWRVACFGLWGVWLDDHELRVKGLGFRYRGRRRRGLRLKCSGFRYWGRYGLIFIKPHEV